MSTAPLPQKPGSFGERLRRERELRGVKLEEIAESTKISKRNLLALEQERFDQLPGGIFNKGFVRAYAKYLGLDEEQAVNDFLAASANYDQPAALAPPPTSLVRPPVIPSEAASRRRQRMWALVAALILVAGLALWFQYGRKSAEPAAPASGAAAAGSASPSETTSSPAAAPEPSPSQQAPGPLSPALPLPANPPSPAGSNSPAPGQSGANAAAAPEPKPVRVNVEPSAGAPEIEIEIYATRPTWVSAIADGSTVLDGTLQAGESRTLRATARLLLKVGNAAALQVSINGKPMPPLGQENQVKSFLFTARKPQ